MAGGCHVTYPFGQPLKAHKAHKEPAPWNYMLSLGISGDDFLMSAMVIVVSFDIASVFLFFNCSKWHRWKPMETLRWPNRGLEMIVQELVLLLTQIVPFLFLYECKYPPNFRNIWVVLESITTYRLIECVWLYVHFGSSRSSSSPINPGVFKSPVPPHRQHVELL